MKIQSNAKVNVGLNVLGKRADGYHDIISLFLPVFELFDVIEISRNDQKSRVVFSSSGLVIPSNDSKNSCILAYEELNKLVPLEGVNIHLEKRIPSGSGFGGGSSNAVFTLIGLNQLFELGLSKAELLQIALEIGSDCPFFLVNEPALVQGRGDKISTISLDLSDYCIKTYFNPQFISTSKAFSELNGFTSNSFNRSLIPKPEEWKGNLVNDFEEGLFRKYPELYKKKSSLYNEGAIYASLSGSGSGMFGLFRSQKQKDE